MIRKFVLLPAFLLLLAAAPAREAAADEPPGGARTEARAKRPANVPFLFSAFAFTWVVLWIYMVHVHRGQRRLEKMLGGLEGPRETEERRG